MMDPWLILLPAFVMSALMIFSHTYLGLHVLARGIIFVDLALAQVAALGISLAFLLGEEPHGLTAQIYAFGATLTAAFAFAGLRHIPGKTMREVIIGCVYVVTTALSIVILSRSSQGMEELKSLFNGSILWVRWQEIVVVSTAYLSLAILHGFFRKQFHALSFGTHEERSPGFLWEFLFFASFAVVITLAVNIAGVLLVFAFLIIPAFSASLVADSWVGRLLVGWSLGLLGAVAGLWLSFTADLPVGATVVSVVGLLPFAAVGLRAIRQVVPQ
ncbi:MAG TPA: iron chelate uptake ABC transporter family permease subunit [Pseudomonadales bacterium]|jgi:zinc/manganese transport system permease protein|nr:iron chelate uptake ABC transporter family permease subunit [Pseudomonadales bacterium]|tara:strand:- start:2437 stop:3255 length:819 start_codon:yes stop_codon:yes gene_type:complete